MPIPRTAAEWDQETNLLQLVKCFRGKAWFPKLQLFAVTCCRRIWDVIPAGVCRDAVDISERFALGCATKQELNDAYRNARAIVLKLQRIDEFHYQYGGLEQAIAQAACGCTLPAEHPAMTVPFHVGAVIAYTKDDAARVAEEIWQVHMLRTQVGHPFAGIADQFVR